MHRLLARFASLFITIIVLAVNSSASAATPFTRATLHGRSYSHRPYYKPYQGVKHRGLVRLFTNR